MRGTCVRAALLAGLIAAWPWSGDIAFAQNAPPAAAWPYTVTADNATTVVYQPQAISWPNHETLTARAAIAITPDGEKTPILGTIEVSMATNTDAATNLVYLSNPELRSSHFPTLDTTQAAKFDDRIRKGLPTLQLRPVPLNAVLLSLKEQSQPAAVQVDNAPPTFFYSDKPASLVVFDGEPVMSPVGKSGLTFAVNTNWDVFSDGKAWWLLNNGTWLTAPAYAGPYKPTPKLPPAFSAIPADQNFAEVRKAVPPPPNRPGVTPVIFVSTKPAEIIVTQGPPQFAPVPGTGLEVVKNTSSELFLLPSSGDFYVLTSGRWFSSHGLSGPWQFATDRLPPDFAMIPPDGPKAQVLPAVPGTSQAQLAVLQAQVPRQATLKKDAAKVAVVYAGQPQFRPIPGTPMMYAVNTSFQVIETGGRYFVCFQGAWFTGPTPNGPWVLAEAVPPVIYTIPPSSPLYNVTYVKVYSATPTAVTFGYTSGYMMGYVSAGVVVYGTGYYYPPVIVPGPVPIYYPYPYSYAGHVTYNTTTGAYTRGGTVYGPYGNTAKGGTYYNPSTGAWAGGGAVYGPNGGAGGFSAYNPSTGSYARGSASWNNSGGSANANAYNARTGTTASTNQNWNAYSRWGSSTITGPNQTVNTQSGSNAQGKAGSFTSSTGAQGAGYRGAGGNQGGAVKTQSGDVYAGHDGNVYQHSSSGWSKWDNGSWQTVNPPSSGTAQNRQTSTQTPAPASTSTQAQRSGTMQTRQQTAQSQRASTGQSPQASRPTMESSSFQQLEQDRQARFSGFQGSGHSGFGGGRFGGGGGGEEHGGRFRR